MKIVRAFIAAALIPVVAALGYELFYLMVAMANRITVTTLPFWLGLGVYGLFQIILAKPLRTYVFGHELTHALAGVLSGAKIKGFTVSASGGSVTLTKTNVWIALSPYFVPIYTVILLGVYWLAGRFWPMAPLYDWFLFGMGFTLSFHCALTWHALMQGQKDLEASGVFFSSVIILLANGIVMVLLLKLLFPGDVGLGRYLLDAAHRTGVIYQWIAENVWVLFQKMK